ncbi:MAG: hypothetical protein E7583_08715 [Ruminococcaceae bacterium]|nr:hypothetical protein [Oscillospiraceae bacterium]
MFCKYCGQKISSKDPKRCPSCGANINIYDYGQSYFDDGELAAWEDKSSLSASSKTVMLGVSSSHSKSSAPSFPAQSVIPETTMRKAVPTPIPSTGMPGFFAKHKLGVIICSVSIVLILTLIVVAILALNKGNDSEENLPRDPGKPTDPNTSIIVDNAPDDTSDYFAVVEVLEEGFGCTIIGRDTSSFDTERKISIELVHNNHNYTLYFFINTNRIMIYDDQAKQTISNDEVENELKIIGDRLSGKRQELESIFEAAFNCEPNQGYYDPSEDIPKEEVPVVPENDSGNIIDYSDTLDLNLFLPDFDGVFYPQKYEYYTSHCTFNYNGRDRYVETIIDGENVYVSFNDFLKEISFFDKTQKNTDSEGVNFYCFVNHNFLYNDVFYDMTFEFTSNNALYYNCFYGAGTNKMIYNYETPGRDPVTIKNLVIFPETDPFSVYIGIDDFNSIIPIIFDKSYFAELSSVKLIPSNGGLQQ